MSYSVLEVYSLSLEDMESCIIPCNADNTKYPSVQLGAFSALTDDVDETLVPYCISSDVIPNNSVFSIWSSSLEKLVPFSSRTPINVRIYTPY
jgi:hypothetical protein